MRNFLLPALACAGCIVGESSSAPLTITAGAANRLYGMNVTIDTPADAVSRLNPSMVRIELVDDSQGPSLSDDVVGRLDRAIADYFAHDISVLLVVGYGTYGGYPRYGCESDDAFAAWRAGFIERLGWIANRYHDAIGAWEVWNEPDHPLHPCEPDAFNPGRPAADFGPLLRDAYTAIRTGSTTPVILGGLDSGHAEYVRDVRAATGDTLFADGIGLHPYGIVPDATTWCPDPGPDLVCAWGSFADKVDALRAVADVPVWFTEFGIKTTDQDAQARYVEGAYRTLASFGDRVGPAFYFCYSDAMVAPFGLTTTDGDKTAPFERYRALATGAL